MNSVGKTLIVLCTFIAAGYGLNCRQCWIGLLKTCFFPKDITCNNGTESCYRGEAQFNATGSLTLHNRGCVDTDLCGKTISGSLLGAAFSSSYTCCTTDLCNSASSLHLSVTAATILTVLSTPWASQ